MLDLPDATTRRGTWSEAQARDLLAAGGVPTVPAALARTPTDAVAASERLGFPVVVKASSPELAHKSDVGAVRLDLRSPDAVRAACEDIAQRLAALPQPPTLDGFLISPMRSGGIELLLGVVRDETWGQVLAVGIGGVWTEILADTSLRILPVTKGDVRDMLDELKGAALLYGTRGSTPADMELLVDVIVRFAELAGALEHELDSLEVNPLRVDGATIEALDALVTWNAW